MDYDLNKALAEKLGWTVYHYNDAKSYYLLQDPDGDSTVGKERTTEDYAWADLPELVNDITLMMGVLMKRPDFVISAPEEGSGGIYRVLIRQPGTAPIDIHGNELNECLARAIIAMDFEAAARQKDHERLLRELRRIKTEMATLEDQYPWLITMEDDHAN